jgi:hypothetical protein
MPIADVKSHQTLTGRPVTLAKEGIEVIFEDYSEFLICIMMTKVSRLVKDLCL